MAQLRDVYGSFKVQIPNGKWVTRYFGPAQNPWLLQHGIPYELESAHRGANAGVVLSKTRARVAVDEAEGGGPLLETWAIRDLRFAELAGLPAPILGFAMKQNPLTRIKKSKIRTQPSQLTGLDPDERLIRRRKKTAAQPIPGIYANPLTRVRVTSPSQRMHEGADGPTDSPTGRLRQRRKITQKAPPGFYANPETLRDRVMPHMHYVVHGNDIWLACFPMKAMADEYRALMAKAHPSRDFKVKPLD